MSQCGSEKEICLILNKRSRNVRQPGDLCCPGGGITPVADAFLSSLVRLPGLHMARWPYWFLLKKSHPEAARRMARFFAAGLREGFEEMRLNPFAVSFLGPLPPERLVIFRRAIYPLAAWVSAQKNFRPNREVEKVLYVPLRFLLNPDYYATYRLEYSPRVEEKLRRHKQDFPCFLYPDEGQKEMLWGATFRVVMNFLRLVFGFCPPDAENLPVIHGTMRSSYLGRKR